MWKDLSFRERAELINQWHKEHTLDYGKKISEYNNSASHKFGEGGDAEEGNLNQMNYVYKGTIYDDELKRQGIDVVTEPLREVVVTGKAPNRPYFSSYDPLALYRYSIEPALEGAGAVMDRALHPVDVAVDTATSPAWWINKAITGNSDNTVQDIRNWTHTALRDAGMLLSPTRDIGTLRTSFEYAPWNPDNPGIAGSDYTGQAMNNTFDLLLAPLGPKAAVEGVKELARTPRARAAAYNNVTPYSYGNGKLGNYRINKLSEIKDMAKEFATPRRIDTSGTPKWKQRWDDWVKEHPEDGLMVTDYDYDVLSADEVMDFRDYSWRKAMRQQEKDPNIYIDNGDGTYSYDYELINKMRKEHGNFPFSGELSAASGFEDNITGNGGNVGIIRNPDGTYTMTDIWDTQPLLGPVNKLKKTRFGRELPPFVVRGLDKIGSIDVVKFFGGDPFELRTTWDPEYFRNLPPEYYPKQ